VTLREVLGLVLRLGLIVAVVVACCGGGWWFYDPLRYTGETFPRAVASEGPKPSWGAGAGAPVDQQLRHELEERVLASAGVVRPLTSECNRATPIPTRCWVEYAGLRMEWRITALSDGPLYKYRAETDAIVITGQGVRESLARWSAKSYELRCDPLPDLALVPVGKPLPQHCYDEFERFEPTKRLKIIPSGERRVDFEED